MAGNRVDNFFIDAIPFRKISTNLGMCTFHIVIHSLAQVVKQCASFRNLNIRAQLSSDHRSQLGSLDCMR